MILVLRKEVVEAIAEDLYNADPGQYDPVWKIKAREQGVRWTRFGKDPIQTVESFIRLVNKHNRGTT